MLRLMRKYQRSFVIYVFFGIIIAVFVVNFGPQSAGCTASTSYAGKIAGQPVTMADFAYAQAVWGMKSQQGSEEQLVQLRGMVMDKLIARELMANDALAMGLEIPAKEIEDMIFQGRYLALGDPRPMVRGDDGNFDYDRFSRYARYYWGVTPRRFREQQHRELLAEKLRQFLRTTVKVSEDEVRADYIHRNTQVKLQFVRFVPDELRGKVALAPKELADFVAKNKQRIKTYYDNNKTAYSKLPRQLDLQLIAVKWADPAGKAKAKANAAAAKKRIAGGEDFGTVASEVSEDDSRQAAGVIGWREAASPGLGSAVTQALRAMKAGQVSDVIEDAGRYVVVKVNGERQGDVPLAQAEEDIARKLLTDTKATEAASVTAAAFIKRAKAGEKLADLFTAEEGDDSKSEDGDKSAEGDKKADADADKATEAKGDAPKVERSPLKLLATSMFPRSPQHLIPRIGISEEINAIAFKLKKGEVADRPFTVGQAVYLVALADRKDPDFKEFDKQKDSLMEDFSLRKWSERVRAYAHDRCLAAAKNNELDVSRSMLLTPGYVESRQKEGKPLELPAYTPCQSLAQRPFPTF